MLEVTVIHVGSLKDKYFRDAVGEYEKRLSAYCRLKNTEIRECPLPEDPSQKEIDAALEKEAEDIAQAIPKRSLVVALCVEGKKLSSSQLAEYFEKASAEGSGKLVFIIGSSFGLAPKIKEISNLRLSFSDMTFPHTLMRVMLAEQIYRAFTICAGKRYHK